jgi:hypothetical protein
MCHPTDVAYPREWQRLRQGLQQLLDDPVLDPAGEYRKGLLMYGDYILANKQLTKQLELAAVGIGEAEAAESAGGEEEGESAALRQEEVEDMFEAFGAAHLQQDVARALLARAGLDWDTLFELL